MRRIFVIVCVALALLGGSAFAQEDAPVLQLVETLPSDGARDVTIDGAVVAVFNRPVVPLTAVEALGSLPNPLRFQPAVSGSGEWLNTAIYIFHPDPGLAGGAAYTVSLDPSLEAQDGARLADAPTWSFTTASPAVTEIVPEPNETGVRLERSLQIRFNMPMDRASVEAAFSLTPKDGADPVAGSFEWADDGAGFRFTPDERLSLDTIYDYGFAATAVGAGGGAALEPQSWSFVTVPAPAVIRTDPFDGQRDAQRYGITFYFASPMNAETLVDRIIIDPEPLSEPNTYYSDYDNSYTLSFSAEPSAEYEVTLAAGAEDIYGNRITQPLTLRYSTSPFDPSLNLEAPYGIGFYNANNAATQVYLTHLNVSRIDLSLYRVPVQDFLPQLVGPDRYDLARLYTPNGEDLLRQWQINSVAPENARRYELLNLSEPGATAPDCPGSPLSRLRVGDRATVISDPDPVRARATPGTGEIVTLLYRDYALRIVGGPECINDVLWWQVELRDGQSAWVAEGVGDEYFIEGAFPVETPIPITSESGALTPGVYYLAAQAPETAELGWGAINHFMIVGTANLVLKQSNDTVTVWATDVSSGQPIAGAEIRVFGEDYSLLGTGTTDDDGLLTVPVAAPEDIYAFPSYLAVLNDGTHFGIGLNQWSSGIEGYDFGQPTNYYVEPFRAYVYTDRPIYRPGQPVYFRGVIRNRDDVRYTVPDLREIPVRITNGDGAVVYEATLALTPYGTFSGQFDLAADAALGSYRVEAELPRPNRDQPYYGSEGIVSFSVAQYRAPEFQVDVTPETSEVVQGDTIRVLVDSRYFFGGVVSNAQVDYAVVAQPYFFSAASAPGYTFVDFNYDAGASELYGYNGGEIASGTGTTDSSGQFLIEVPADLRDATQSMVFTIEAVVTDESAQAVAGRAQVVVHTGLVYVGVQPREYVVTAGSETVVDVIAVDWAAEGLPGVDGQSVEIEVVERRWSSVQEQDAFGRTTWSYEVEDIPVTSGSVITGDDGQASYTFAPPAGGIYKVTARTRDARGNAVVASASVYVSSSEYVVWRQQNSNRIDLVADQTNYQVGDTAEILIASPFQGAAQALVTVERGDVLKTEVITLESNSFVYRLPIEADYSPNVFVSVFIVKGVDANNPVAAFRMGIVQLGVDTAQRALSLTITPDTDQAGPGDAVTYTLRATDYAGNPVRAEIGVGLTDLASLSISEPNSLPILSYFYGQQGLSVRTSSVLTINADQLTQEVLDTIKGGGGGFGEGGIFDIREEFIDTAYWNAALVTDANGEARFTVTLPDNLTTWRLDARALTRGTNGDLLVGQETADLISTLPLLIRPITPRFFVTGDQATVAAVVNNNTDQDLQVEVRLDTTAFQGETAQAPDASLVDDAAQTVRITAGGRTRVEWQIAVPAATSFDFTFFAQTPDRAFTDASKPPLARNQRNGRLPIYSYSAPEMVATGGVIESGQSVTETVRLPADLNADSAHLSLNVQPSLAAAALTGLSALDLPPYPSAEQVVSSFLPNLMARRALEAIGADETALLAALRERIAAALQVLYSAQKVDGGWGWYARSDSDIAVTTYALIGLAEAQAQGYEVFPNAIRGAQTFLRRNLIVPGLDRAQWELNRQALVLYALARSGAPDAARTATLYEMRASLDVYAQALLARTLALSDAADARVTTILDDLARAAIVSVTGVHWEEAQPDRFNWNTDSRTTAIVLDALATLRPQTEQIPGAVRWLITARRADGWETRQETAWALMALGSAAVALGEQAGATAEVCALLDAQDLIPCERIDANRSASRVELPPDVSSALTIRSQEGTVYYTAQLTALLPTPEVQPLNRGIAVERRYTMGAGDSLATVNGARVGDTVTVHLTIIAPNDLHYVVVEDPIPAGTDAVDPQLSTSQQIGTRPELNLQDPLSQGWGWWWFADIAFRDDRVVLSAAYLPAGTYEFVYTLRAGLPGVYNVIPAVAREAYFPEVFGRSAGASFTIESGE